MNEPTELTPLEHARLYVEKRHRDGFTLPLSEEQMAYVVAGLLILMGDTGDKDVKLRATYEYVLSIWTGIDPTGSLAFTPLEV